MTKARNEGRGRSASPEMRTATATPSRLHSIFNTSQVQESHGTQRRFCVDAATPPSVAATCGSEGASGMVLQDDDVIVVSPKATSQHKRNVSVGTPKALPRLRFSQGIAISAIIRGAAR